VKQITTPSSSLSWDLIYVKSDIYDSSSDNTAVSKNSFNVDIMLGMTKKE